MKGGAQIERFSARLSVLGVSAVNPWLRKLIAETQSSPTYAEENLNHKTSQKAEFDYYGANNLPEAF